MKLETENLFVGACCEPVKSSLALGHIADNRVSLKAMYSENGGQIWTNSFFLLTSRLFTVHLCQNTPHLFNYKLVFRACSWILMLCHCSHPFTSL